MTKKDEIIEAILNDQEQEEEMLLEMATVAREFELNWSIAVNPDSSRNDPVYFKLYDSVSYGSATKCARISFLAPKYVVHNDSKEQWILNNKEKKLLVGFLNSKQRGRKKKDSDMSNWKYAIALWNKEMGYIDDEREVNELAETDTPLPFHLEPPDYTELS